MRKLRREIEKKGINWNSKKVPCSDIPQDLKDVLKGRFQINVNTERYSELLTEIKDTDRFPLTMKNYKEYLGIALYAEEYQQESDLKDYDMSDKQLKRDDRSGYKIEIEGLEEDRPSVRIGDRVKIIDARGDRYFLKVTKTFKKYIVVDEEDPNFAFVYNANDLYGIQFCFNNYTFRCCHYSLQLIHKCDLMSYVFPVKFKNRNQGHHDITWFNQNIAENPEQRQAVTSILNKKQGPPYILYGPPGTGKTVTLIEAICQVNKKLKISKKNASKRIVVCTPSNSSADLMTKRLMEYKLGRKDLIRLYCTSIKADAVDKDIINCSNCIEYVENGERKVEVIMPPMENMPRIIILTLITCTRLLLERMRVAYVFFDEAGQATEAESTIPFCLLRSDRPGKLQGHIVLAGDHNQLGPVVMSSNAKPLLGKSMLERLMRLNPYLKDKETGYNRRYITKLVRNYRSHPDIIHISNKLFYSNELIPCNEMNVRWCENWEMLPNRSFPIIFEGVRGVERSQVFSEKYKSFYNLDEMIVVFRYIQLLVGSKINDRVIRGKDIGVVTPFTSQNVKIRHMIDTRLKLPNTKSEYDDIEVGSVQLYQGREKEIIIFTAVRSNAFYNNPKNPLGFLSNPKRFNVALTRAKSLLIIIGHPETLAEDKKTWNVLLKYCDENNACKIVKFD